MSLPVAESSQWLINLGTIAAAGIAAIAAWLFKHFETRRAEPEPKGGMAVVAGALLDARHIERLCDQLAHNERAIRDQERALIDNTRELHRTNEAMSAARHALEARNAASATADEAMLEAIRRAANRPSQTT